MMSNANTCTLQGVTRNATTCTLQNTMHNASTCTCNIVVPVCTSTPNRSPRSMVDCCPNVSIIENTCPQSSIVISRDCSDLDDEIVLQCSESNSSGTICSEPNMACCKREAQKQLNKTCDLTRKTSCEKTKTCLSTKTCPSTVDIAKDWLSNKTSELKHKIQDLVYPKPCESKHVNFSNSCELKCKHDLDPSPCQSVKSCNQAPDSSCERCDPTPCQPVKSFRYIDIAGKLCELCKHVLDTAPCQPAKPSRHVDIADKLCDLCKQILDCAPCHSDKSCKHCDVVKKLCNECKLIFDSAPCIDRSCKNVDIASMLCEQCKYIYDSTPCQNVKSCMKLVDITVDKSCNQCKGILSPAPCKPVQLCKSCDISTKLCKECKNIFDSAPCADRSCKNVEIVNKLCEYCKHIYESAPCQSIKPCMKSVDIADKPCGTCKIIPQVAPCQPDDVCKKCDISTKLCKVCRQIFDSVPCAYRSCKYIDITNKLCELCRHIYESATCQSITPEIGMKPVDIVDKPCETPKIIPQVGPCQPENSCKNCDVSTKLCKKCRHILDSSPCADRSCKSVELTNMLCEHCRSIYASAICQQVESCKKPCQVKCENDRDPSPCQSVKPCVQVDVIEKSREQCKHDPDPVLCQPVTPCGRVYTQVPEEELGCKKLEELYFNDKATESLSPELWKSEKISASLESQSAATLTTLSPIIKQEAKSTSFDTAKESICRSSGSGPESPGGSCASARARYFQNKLLATLQILQNKEETVRVQAESIAIAESRIAALNARHTDLRREIDRKEREIQCIRKELKECRACRVNTFDASVSAEIQDMDDQKNIVTTLQNNLGVIEDLYRECFHETVKQDNLIEMLRKSYLDVRLMDKEKSDRISKLHNVINTQKWSLDRCQDIATEVDNLKIEISNFINSSNNDSGMWEESVVGGLSEDLQDIAAQLLTLGDLLTGECTCGLEQENKRLRQENECMQGEICGLRTEICNLEENLQKSCDLHRQCKEQVESKERELQRIHERLNASIENASEKAKCYDLLKQQFTETKALLDDKSTELCCLQKQSRDYENTIQDLKEELNKSEVIAKENEELRKELCCVSRRGARVRRRAADLEAELARAREHCEGIQAAYREKTASAVELERQLEAAHARGAELCAEAGRVVRAARCWAARMRGIHREQEKLIKQKECKLRCIQNELHRRQLNICPRIWEQIEEYCSACSSAGGTSKRSEGSCPPAAYCAGESRREGTGSSGSEVASCSSSPAAPCASGAALQVSPGEEMFSRMENLSAALADRYKRWSRRAPS